MNHLKEIKRIKRYKKKKKIYKCRKRVPIWIIYEIYFSFFIIESENVLLSIKNKYLILKKTQYLYTMNQNIIPLIVMINTGFTNA